MLVDAECHEHYRAFPEQAVGPFLAELAVASLHKSCGILCTFPRAPAVCSVVSGVLHAQPAAPSLSVLPVPPGQPRHDVRLMFQLPCLLIRGLIIALMLCLIVCLLQLLMSLPLVMHCHRMHANSCADMMQLYLLLVLAQLRDAASLPISL